MEGAAKVIVGLGEFRIEFDRAAKRGDGIIEPSNLREGQAHIDVCFGEARVQSNGLACGGHRVVRLSRPTVHFAQIVVVNHLIGIDRDRPGNQIDRLVEPAGLTGKCAEKMQRIG